MYMYVHLQMYSKSSLGFNLMSIEIKISWSGPPSPSHRIINVLFWSAWYVVDLALFRGLCTFQLFCCICVFIPTTVLNGQVLFAISIMFLCRFHKARELNTIFGTKSLSQFPFFRCRSFTCFLRHREINKKRAVFINYSGSNKKWIDRFLL
jgi:hypothetical protein